MKQRLSHVVSSSSSSSSCVVLGQDDIAALLRGEQLPASPGDRSGRSASRLRRVGRALAARAAHHHHHTTVTASDDCLALATSWHGRDCIPCGGEAVPILVMAGWRAIILSRDTRLVGRNSSLAAPVAEESLLLGFFSAGEVMRRDAMPCHVLGFFSAGEVRARALRARARAEEGA